MKTEEFNIWEGIYESFPDAARDAIGPGFSGAIYRDRARAVAKECLVALEAGRPIPPLHKQRSNLLPPVASMLIPAERALRILDLGGGLGIGYMTLLESMPAFRERINYTIVELPEICEEGRKLHSGKIEYIEELPVNGQYDFVHSSSALQYIEHWRSVLRYLASLQAAYMLLTDVFAGPNPTFATLQNYYGSRIQHWFLNVDELLDCALASGYRALMCSPAQSRRLDADDVLPMSNFPPTHRVHQSLHILLGLRH